MEPYTVTIMGTGKSIDFYIFVKFGYYPLLPLACTCLLFHTVIVYCILYEDTLQTVKIWTFRNTLVHTKYTETNICLKVIQLCCSTTMESPTTAP